MQSALLRRIRTATGSRNQRPCPGAEVLHAQQTPGWSGSSSAEGVLPGCERCHTVGMGNLSVCSWQRLNDQRGTRLLRRTNLHPDDVRPIAGKNKRTPVGIMAGPLMTLTRGTL